MQKSQAKFIFVSNYMNHHQIPFCNAMYQLLGGNFAFCQTEEVEKERINMGWEAEHRLPYLMLYQENPAQCQKMIDESAVVFFGGTDEEKYIQYRLLNKKTVIRYSERIYKTGQWKAVSPRGLRKKYLDHTRYRKEPVFMLCAGAYVPTDFHIVRAYPQKLLKWGYFPETKHYDVDNLMRGKNAGYIVWAARMIDWKHPDLPVRVAAYLRDRGCTFHMDIIGGGALENSVKSLVKELKLEDVVSLPGFMTPGQVRECMEKADVYLVTSDRQEGWGAVINEAMNSGCAVVANHMIGAAPYLLKQEVNGLLYRDGDMAGLCGLVEKLITDRAYCQRLGCKAYDTITRLWNAEEAARQLAGLCIRQGFLNAQDFPGLKGEALEKLTEEPGEGPISPAPVISERKMYGILVKNRLQ